LLVCAVGASWFGLWWCQVEFVTAPGQTSRPSNPHGHVDVGASGMHAARQFALVAALTGTVGTMAIPSALALDMPPQAPVTAPMSAPMSAPQSAPMGPPITKSAPTSVTPITPDQQTRVNGRVTYSRLLEFIDDGSVARLDVYDTGHSIVAEVNANGRTQTLVCDVPGITPTFLKKTEAKGVIMNVHTPEKPNPMFAILGDIAFPGLLIAGLLFFRNRPGGGGMPGMPGQNKAKIQMQPDTGVKFEDVAGIDEAKQELTEIVDFLKAPERFVKVGAKIPRGVLLTGPPGTGKTLMAKALAGEAGVPFIQSSAAEFIELFVGVGASRVRDIFKQAKEKAPCIVFIDEIDAIGRQRGAGMGGGNDEREQTLNQILTEMDGFEGNSGVIVVAATNRDDILDSALLRPGRFDRRVKVDLPDVDGREQILKVHLKNKKLAEGISVGEVAKRTAGMSGADLENLMNESAILTARRSKKAITMEEINDATDRVTAGIQGKALSNDSSRRLLAYHECGKALVGTLLPYHDPVSKVTLIPRGSRQSLTWFSPDSDQSLISLSSLRARITGALGGRAAEEVVYGKDQVTTNAGNDLAMVDQIARAMVTQVGMSGVGPIAIDQGGMLGPSYSEELGTSIDEAIGQISSEEYDKARLIISENRACLDKLSAELVEVETLTGDRIREIVSGFTEIPEKLSAV